MAKVYSADAASVFFELMAEWNPDLDTAHHCGHEFVREAQLELSDDDARKLAMLLSIVYSEAASIRISLSWREAGMYLLRFALWERLYNGVDFEQWESLLDEDAA